MAAADRIPRPDRRLTASGYVLVVAAVATVGFTTASTPTILLAAALTLPASVVAVPSVSRRHKAHASSA